MVKKEMLVILDDQGRVFVPSKLRKELGLKAGDMLLVKVKDKNLEITTLAHAIKGAKEIVKRYARGRKLWRELLEERKKEAQHE